MNASQGTFCASYVASGLWMVHRSWCPDNGARHDQFMQITDGRGGSFAEAYKNVQVYASKSQAYSSRGLAHGAASANWCLLVAQEVLLTLCKQHDACDIHATSEAHVAQAVSPNILASGVYARGGWTQQLHIEQKCSQQCGMHRMGRLS